MTAALTRRSKVLLVAGALVLALLVNVAWVAFGPSDGGDRGAVESAVRRAWAGNGIAPRTVACTESDGSWTCQIESSRGDNVSCPIGAADTFLKHPAGTLSNSCKTE